MAENNFAYGGDVDYDMHQHDGDILFASIERVHLFITGASE